MSRKMNRRGDFDRNRHHNDDDVEDKLDDIIKLLKKILEELKDIEDELDDKNNDHGKGGTGGSGDCNNHGHHKCKCCKKKDDDDCKCCKKKDDEDCECDAVLIAFRSNPNPDERFGEILAVDSSGGNFGCNLTERMGGMQGASVAQAIACLKCKGFKVQSVEETNGPRQTVLLTRKKCDD